MMQILLSLPPRIAEEFNGLKGKALPDWVPSFDPPGRKLGSGGGTAHLLVDAWRKTGDGSNFQKWLADSKKLMIHAGGESRRLPAYAPVGKSETPIPVMRWSRGQRLDQTLVDLQLPLYEEFLRRSGPQSVAMVTAGDVLLRGSLNQLGPLAEVDVLCVGLWTPAEQAQHHGVFFCPRGNPATLSFFLQKPSPEEIRERVADSLFLIDTGLWLLSERAVRVLLGKCGWNWDEQCFQDGLPNSYELYAEFGLGLGENPTAVDPDVNRLTCAVAPLPEGQFYHFGTSRDLIRSCAELQNCVLDQREVETMGLKPHAEMFVLNTPKSDLPLAPENHTLWIENARVPASWTIHHDHVITGVPENDWAIEVPRGLCLDMVPVDESNWCLRVYGIDDPFRGPFGDEATCWCNGPAGNWLADRGLTPQPSGIDLASDLQETPLFPVIGESELDPDFIQWLLAPTASDKHKATWLAAERLSAQQIGQRVNLKRLYSQKRDFRHQAIKLLADNSARSVFYMLDLEQTAEEYAQTDFDIPAAPGSQAVDLMKRVHHEMFQASVLRHRDVDAWREHEEKAFNILREAIVEPARQNTILPGNTALDDQIIWGRSPVRMDLAGGWTDTPPHCLIHGGKVVNIAVDLNGQPPIQVFAKRCEQPHIVLRSIDLGIEERITSFEELRGYAKVSSGFSIAKAAFSLSGFASEFSSGEFPTLRDQLEALGGGIEISLLAAVPKGSGLGTSSILAATLLGTLGELCGLNWDLTAISRRAMILEQMLTTGGGWQDQVGGIVRGLKLIETEPGLQQTPVVRWVPDHLFSDARTQSCMLLYYTGITRVAKNILAEIVRGMFLNSHRHESVLQELAEHASATYDVLIRGDWESLCECIDRSWVLNQRLDSGTNPPGIEAILRQIDDYLAGAKLPGAGGGGYLFMLAKDPQAAVRIRETLTQNPPNGKARFVDFQVSQTGLEITRS